MICFAVSGIIGALKSERNVVGVGLATVLPLIKRKLMQEIEGLGHDAAGEQETAYNLPFNLLYCLKCP